MRNKIQDSITVRLENGIALKAEYKAAFSGVWITLYVVDAEGRVLGTVHTKGSLADDMAQVLREKVAGLRLTLEKYKINQMTTYRILAAVVPEVLKREYRKAA